jgi:hypothetical protein
MPVSLQIARLIECERVLVALELSNFLNDSSYALQAVTQCYGLLAPIIYHNIVLVPVIQVRLLPTPAWACFYKDSDSFWKRKAMYLLKSTNGSRKILWNGLSKHRQGHKTCSLKTANPVISIVKYWQWSSLNFKLFQLLCSYDVRYSSMYYLILIVKAIIKGKCSK